MANLTNGAKAFLGTFATDAATLVFIQSNFWDSNSDGTGTPQNGMFYYNTAVNARRIYLNNVWVNDTLNQQQIYFVSKAGLDTNSGLNQDDPFLTIAAAIAAATAQIPATNNRFAIIVLDAGIYTENFTVPSWVAIRGLECTVNGTTILSDDSSLSVASCTLAAGVGVTKSAGAGSAFAEIREMRLTGAANGCLCTSGELLLTAAGLIRVENGYGVGTTSTTGILHCVINNIDVTGTGIGIGAAGVGATVAGTINNIDDIPGNGTGVYVGNGVTVDLSIQRLSCTLGTAYNVIAGGTLALFVSTITGTQTNNGTANVTIAGQAPTHTIDDHTVGVVAATYFPMNVGGAIVSSNGQSARCSIMTATNYLLAGANLFFYGTVAGGGFAAGSVLLSNVAGSPLRINHGNRTDTDGSIAITIGPASNGTTPELDSCSIGYYDSSGASPFVWHPVFNFKADGLIRATASNITTKWMVDGGKMAYDATNNILATGFKDLADATIDTDVWTDQTGGSSAAKAAGVTTITVANGVGSDWFGGAYTEARLEGVILPRYSDWEVWVHITHDGAVNDQGGTLGVLFDDTDADFVHMHSLRTGGTSNIYANRGAATQLYGGVGVGAQATWLKIAFYGGVVHYLYFNGAIGTDPTDAQWVEVATYTPTWVPTNLTLFIGAVNVGALPGCTPEFGRVTVQFK